MNKVSKDLLEEVTKSFYNKIGDFMIDIINNIRNEKEFKEKFGGLIEETILKLKNAEKQQRLEVKAPRFSARIKLLRNQRNLTQIDLARMLNEKYKLKVSNRIISYWEREENGEGVPKFVILKALSDYFEVSINYLIGEDHERR